MQNEIMSVIEYALKDHGIEDMPAEYTVKIEGDTSTPPVIGGHPSDIFLTAYEIAIRTLKDVDCYQKESKEPVFSVHDEGSVLSMMGEPIWEVIPF